ncbi:MAG: hypothetical protein FJY85_18830, partial [Deltaproteobacteria bacterium]|nr:hypothetical protein [Deltaproteobacteria bacterium]
MKTRDLLNYGYEYWHQMFNERQLLCLGMLLDAILRIPDMNIRELLVMTLADAVNANNMFSKYHAAYQKIEPLFGLHAYHPIGQPMENNVWGTKFGKNTFLKTYQKTRRGKEYCIRPFERDGAVRRKTGDTVAAELADDFDGVLTGKGDALLWAQTSEDLSSIPDGSIDAVVSDPAYCDNVQYAELADFFYVWLRLALKDRYPTFAADYSPKAREIVKNEAQDKDDAFFFRGLTRVFRECNRVLKDDGLFTFTFHHKETWAWKSVLSAILDSGFCVVAIYPVRSEKRGGFHAEVGNIGYDIPFVCRKRRGGGQAVSWEALKDEIYFAAQESVERIKTSGRSISDADLFVIVMGRCLELYSKHWPNVLKEGQQVDVDQAVDDLDDLVDSLIKSYELKLLPASLDDTT